MTALILALCTSVGMIACVCTGASIKKLHLPLYWVVTLLGAIALLVFGQLPLEQVGEELLSNRAVNPLKILVLFLSMTMLSVFLDEAGFFKFLAAKVLSKVNGSTFQLFLYLYVTVSLLTIVTSNDIVILTFTPFICYFCRSANIHPLPFLFGEFVAANTFSMTLMIGNPTNIYLALANGITFGQYVAVMWLPALLGGVVAFGMLCLIFHKSLRQKIVADVPQVTLNRPLVVIGGIHLALCTILLAIADYIGLEMWIISLCFAGSLFVFVGGYMAVKRQKPIELLHTARRAPWQLVPFLLSMFIIVSALDYNGVTKMIYDVLSHGQEIWVYGAVSTLLCNVVNNIPMSVLISAVGHGGWQLGGVYASIIGSNLGAIVTPIGALAGIMWANILKEQGVRITFLQFTKYGIVVAVPTLVASLLGLLIIL